MQYGGGPPRSSPPRAGPPPNRGPPPRTGPPAAPRPATPAASPASAPPKSTSKRPLDVLHTSLNQRVIVLLKGNREYRGLLDGYDHPHLNLVLKNAEEFVDGEAKRTVSAVLVRGDNIIYISP